MQHIIAAVTTELVSDFFIYLKTHLPEVDWFTFRCADSLFWTKKGNLILFRCVVVTFTIQMVGNDGRMPVYSVLVNILIRFSTYMMNAPLTTVLSLLLLPISNAFFPLLSLRQYCPLSFLVPSLPYSSPLSRPPSLLHSHPPSHPPSYPPTLVPSLPHTLILSSLLHASASWIPPSSLNNSNITSIYSKASFCFPPFWQASITKR